MMVIPDGLQALSLKEKQHVFVRMVANLIEYATSLGFDLSFGEVKRTPEQAALNKAKGIGTGNSLHCDSLAVDLNLFKAGVYLSMTEYHQPLGEFWESMGGSWGGRFGDGNHYSLSHGGRK